jgi:WD40 repeat protein
MNTRTRPIALTALFTLGACVPGLQSDPGVTHRDGAVDDAPDGQIDPPDGAVDDAPDGQVDPSDGPPYDAPDGATDTAPPIRFAACGTIGSGGIRAIAAATNLPRAVVGYGSGRAALIDTASLSVQFELPAHDRGVTCAAMSMDGTRTATSSETGEIIVSRTDDGQELARIQTGGFRFDRLALSPDGGLVAAHGPTGGLRLWRVDDGSMLWARGEGDPFLLRFLDDGQTLVSGGYGLVNFRRVSNGIIQGEASFEAMNGAPHLRDASGDGTLFVGIWRGGFGLWRTGQESAAWTTTDPGASYGPPVDPLRPQISPDGTTLALRGTPSGIRLARASDGSELGSFPGRATSVAFDHAGSILVGDSDGTLHRVSTSGHEEMVAPAPPGHRAPLIQVAFSPDGRLFATSANDGEEPSESSERFTVKVWRAQDGVLLFTAPVANVRTRRAFAFSPDSASVAVVGLDRRIRLLQSSDGRELAVIGDDVEGVVFTSDGRSLMGSMYGRLERRAFRRWRTADGVEEPGVGRQGVAPLGFAFSPDGSQVAILTAHSPWSTEGLSLWRVTDESPLWSARVGVEGFQYAAPTFSPDGSQVAISALQVLAAADGALIKDLRPEGWSLSSSGDVGYSRDGALVTFTDGYGALRVFRTSDWMPAETPSGAFSAAAFSPTEDRLLLGGNDNIVRLLCQEDR